MTERNTQVTYLCHAYVATCLCYFVTGGLCASGNRSLGGQLELGEKNGCSMGSLDPRGAEIGRFLAWLYIVEDLSCLCKILFSKT